MTARTIASAVFGLAVFFLNGPVWAQTSYCDGLNEKGVELMREIFASFHPYYDCDESFVKCLAKPHPHKSVVRVANDICRQISLGKDKQQVERALTKRAQSMLPTLKPATFSLDPNTLAGNPNAPITVVVYACARCPFCAVLVPNLYKEVTQGILRDKVRLYLRPFPIKSHPGSIEGGLALLSAARLDHFWPYALVEYQRFDQFCPDLLSKWATEVGIDETAFERELNNPQNRESLINAKREGIRNRVDATPTLFIDGRKYVYELQHDVVVDVLLEAYESGRP